MARGQRVKEVESEVSVAPVRTGRERPKQMNPDPPWGRIRYYWNDVRTTDPVIADHVTILIGPGPSCIDISFRLPMQEVAFHRQCLALTYCYRLGKGESNGA